MRLSAFLFTLLLAGCGTNLTEGDDGDEGGNAAEGGGGEGGGGGCSKPSGTGDFALGQGEDCFEEVVPGQQVPMFAGPQGGYHVWLAVGCGDCGSSIHAKWGVRDPATGSMLAGTYDNEAVLDLYGDSWRQHAGIVVGMPGLQWDVENDPPLPPGSAVVVWLQILDDGGAVVREAEIEEVIGQTQVWDPCAEDPNDPNCSFG